MLALAVLLLLVPALAWADVSDPVRVVDGDTMEIGETRIRLLGIDAPEGRNNGDSPTKPE